jgi:HD superfamily phosphodiesterase
MNLNRTIESAEKQYKQILEEFFISVYNEKSLSSHGIDHHRRVWNYSKELLRLIPPENTTQFSRLPSDLIIASYLHDIGMSVDPGVKHGKHSRRLSLRFLNQNNLNEKEYKDALEAIENHDNKDYTSKSSMNDLLTILSVSDDLDALGFIGIFRYSEIYLRRGISSDKIGFQIRENVKKRFDNFVKTFSPYCEIVLKYRKRYNILDDFFIKYNEQLPAYHFGTLLPSGYCGLIEIFLFMMNNNLQIKDLFTEPEKYSDDPLILSYFAELSSELLMEHTVF